MTFADPASPSGIDYTALQGALLMFKVLGVEADVPTAYSIPGQKNPAIRADLTVIDGAQAGTELEDTLVFPRVLQGQLRSRVGQLVLGRLGQGVAKPGNHAPWRLEAATDQDKKMAEEWLRKKSTPTIAAPAGEEPPF